ncbi:MAG TPA: N-acetylmuramoyl-L-alanine amidase [Candidatus Limnocylindria bacterium]|nr:N-acetylmuramoyl-L-alanine amidase [Candidatus Limnocylindria bacterium]
MRRPLSKKRLALLIGLFLLALFPNAGPPAVASPRATGQVVANEVTIASPATTGTLTTQGGTTILAPDAGSTGGETLLFTSPTISANQLYDRVGVHWVAAPGTQDSFFVELRTSADAASWSEWQLLTPDEDMANMDTNEWYAAPQLAVDNARYAQYRVWLTAGDPAAVVRVGLTFMDVSDLNAGPFARAWNDLTGALHDIARSFTEPSYANAAPTGAPRILARSDWAADENIMRWVPKYPQRIQKAVVHHTVTDDGKTNVAATIRSIYYFHAVTRGWGDIGYSYLVDKYGNIWTGRQGGDATEGGHAYGWNKGSIGIAAIGTYSVTNPSPSMVAGIASIIAMKFSQFGLQPFGADQYVHQEQASDGSWINVTSNPPNVQGHRDCNYVQSQYGGQTACPGNALYGQLTNIRTIAQNAVQQGFWQMPLIETSLAKAAYPGAALPVTVTVVNKGKTAIPAGTRVSYRIVQRANVIVPQGGATALPELAPGSAATVQVPFTTPALGSYLVRWDLQTGSAWWNTANGTPVREQWFRSADWSVDWVSDNVPISWTAGETKLVTATVANDGGRVWNATGASPVRLGYEWVSSATGNRFPGANRVALPADVQPGGTLTLPIPITAPVYPTNYVLTLDLYKEGEFKFGDKGVADNDNTVGVGIDFKAGYAFASQPPFAAGQTANVPVTITNRGNGTFPVTNSFPVNLGYHWTTPSGANVVWDGARTKLPSDLLTGQSVTVNAAVTAPTAGGTYTLKLDLVQEGVAWFSIKGVATGNVAVAIAGPVVASFGATYAPGLPTGAMAGTQTTVPVTVTNTSNFTWQSAGANPVTLSYHWANTAGQTVAWDGLRTKLTADLAPGAAAVLQANVRFPAAAGTYVLRWDAVQEGVAWFSSKGVTTMNQSVAVTPFVTPFYGGSLDVTRTPDTMPARLTITVPLRIQNLSNFDFGSSINLSYHWYDSTGKVVVWDGLRTPLAGMRRTELHNVIATVAVPAQPGTYTLRYDIVHEGVTWFSAAGMQTPAETVIVVVPQLSALYTVPSMFSGVANGTVAVPVTLVNAGTATWQPGSFNLAYHLYTANGAVLVWDGARTGLAAPVAPGQTVTVNATVRVPALSGTFSIAFDLVQEGVAWFSGQGVPVGSATLQVP